jgi:general secretion pathway protein F
MDTATLDDFMALNDQLAALAQAGVPLDIDVGRQGADPAAALEKINALIARRVSQGATVADALESEQQAVTPSYRSLMQVALRSGNVSAALNGSHSLAESVADSWQTVLLSLLYPTVVCSFAFAGLIGCCVFFVPKLESMYESMRIQPGLGLALLRTLRDTLPYWIAIPPLALILAVIWSRTQSQRAFGSSGVVRILGWLPGMSRTILQQRWVTFAESLAALLEGGVSLEEALRITAGAGEGNAAAAQQPGQALSENSPWGKRLPPFLRWALWHSEATTGRVRALRIAAGIYLQAAQHRVDRWRVLLPVATCVILGGGVTLLYGMALFVPVVEMLRGLAS